MGRLQAINKHATVQPLTVKQKNFLQHYQDCKSAADLSVWAWDTLKAIGTGELSYEEVSRFLADQFNPF